MSTARPIEDRRRRLSYAVMVLALLFTVLLIVRTSSAAFTAVTDNSGNSVVAGDVQLTDDDTPAGTPMFTETAFAPGETATECIEVTYDGTIPDPQEIRLYSGGFTDVTGPDAASSGLSDQLLLTVEEGAGGTFGSCAGFTPAAGAPIVNATTLAAFDTASNDYASGVSTLDPTATGQSISYRFSIELDAAVDNEEQGASTTDIAFIWEVTS